MRELIPTKANAVTFEGYVQNIVRAYEVATPDQLARGLAWYPDAHDFAAELGDVRTVAGVIAALSANKRWSVNVKLATDACEYGNVHGNFGDALRKAHRILDGEDPAEVLPGQIKTGQFFRCIVDPTDPDAVVIDRHAHDIAVGEVYGERNRGLSNVHRYETLANAYREAAHRLHVLPQEVQAVTWTAHTD
jgi:hypothetical protein